jgi:hypothetical protein
MDAIALVLGTMDVGRAPRRLDMGLGLNMQLDFSRLFIWLLIVICIGMLLIAKLA